MNTPKGDKSRLVGLLVLLAIVGLLATAYHATTWETYQRHVGYQGEANRVPVWAWIRLMQNMGMETRHFDNLHEVGELPKEGTLVVTAKRIYFSSSDYERIYQWVIAGGHLVIELGYGDFLEGGVDPVSEILHFDQDWSQEGYEEFMIPWPGRTEPMNVIFPSPQRLVPLESGAPDPPEVLGHRVYRRHDLGFCDSLGDLIAVFDVGRGRITALSDSGSFSAENLPTLDNAEYAYRLVSSCYPQGLTLFVFGDSYPTLGQLIFGSGWMALISLAALVTMWIWQVAPRLGPILADPPRERRRLSEHIEASGRFLWQYDRGRALLDVTRAAAWARIRQRRPDWMRLPVKEVSLRLSQLCGLSAQQVERGLADRGKDTGRVRVDAAEFFSLVKTLEKIRRAL